ncbi:hypothetical protein THAOC_14565 [Thalassiosira oceanica]|uniref:Uncharacterized protein n=1 Tax=Thalassiosira oceanica TaxID=159749 RepID=K0SEZ9_THAOC|nr:hypothetical protein THAOC_14565 [Thalassiosira oceanica]|eukprot:EJK64678.1 hypothetical protein THAOC_14565 [Thalassiosira oceanica]
MKLQLLCIGAVVLIQSAFVASHEVPSFRGVSLLGDHDAKDAAVAPVKPAETDAPEKKDELAGRRLAVAAVEAAAVEADVEAAAVQAAEAAAVQAADVEAAVAAVTAGAAVSAAAVTVMIYSTPKSSVIAGSTALADARIGTSGRFWSGIHSSATSMVHLRPILAIARWSSLPCFDALGFVLFGFGYLAVAAVEAAAVEADVEAAAVQAAEAAAVQAADVEAAVAAVTAGAAVSAAAVTVMIYSTWTMIHTTRMRRR